MVKSQQPLLDLSIDCVRERVGLQQNVVINADDNSTTDNEAMSETFSHVQRCLCRALEGISLDKMTQIFAVVNNNDNSVDQLISLGQSNQSFLKDELSAILHQQVSWYHCSGEEGDMLLLQDLLQNLDYIPVARLSNLFTEFLC